MSIDFLSSFGGLDELIQIIYQGANRFVVLSSVDDEKWSLYLGLSGPQGRWWRGTWSQDDVLKLGPNPSSFMLDTFAEKLADTFTKGGLYISDWTPDRDAELKLTFDPTSKHPIHVPLVELTSEEAASHATEVFLEIALQAQSRNHRLNAPAYTATSTRSYSPPRTSYVSKDTTLSQNEEYTVATNTSSPPRAKTTVTSSPKPKPNHHVKDGNRTSSSKAEPARQEAKQTPVNKKIEPTTSKPVTQKRSIKGASLANPSKKARKYQALEFASDDE